MPLSQKHRSVSIGKILILPPKNTSAPQNLFKDIEPEYILDGIVNKDFSVVFGDGETERRIGILESGQFSYENQPFRAYIIFYADKDIPPSSFMEYSTKAFRTETKSDDEAGVYSGHLIICRHNTTNEFLFALERVPGVSLSSLKRLISDFLKENPIERTYEKEVKRKRKPRTETKTVRCVIHILGRESESIRQALSNGVFEGIEYRLEYKEKSQRMEVPALDKARESASWTIGKKVNLQTSEEIINRVISHTFGAEEEGKRRFFLKITTADDITKTTEITDFEHPLEQAFIHNERIRGFSEPLPQLHDQIHEEFCQKAAKKMLK